MKTTIGVEYNISAPGVDKVTDMKIKNALSEFGATLVRGRVVCYFEGVVECDNEDLDHVIGNLQQISGVRVP